MLIFPVHWSTRNKHTHSELEAIWPRQYIFWHVFLEVAENQRTWKGTHKGFWALGECRSPHKPGNRNINLVRKCLEIYKQFGGKWSAIVDVAKGNLDASFVVVTLCGFYEGRSKSFHAFIVRFAGNGESGRRSNCCTWACHVLSGICITQKGDHVEKWSFVLKNKLVNKTIYMLTS